MEDMAQARTAPSPVRIVVGGDEFLNRRTIADLKAKAMHARPDAELIELDAGQTDRYAFEEAIGPSLLSDCSIVIIHDVQDADEPLVTSMCAFCRQANEHPQDSSILIAQHEGRARGRRIVDALVKAGALKETVPVLDRDEAKLNFVLSCFERDHRRVEPLAAQRLVAVLGDSTAELASMCSQLCFDFDADPLTVRIVDQYLTANPKVARFTVADRAVEGKTATALIAMRASIEQGADPIMLIGELAAKLRTIAKASAVRSGALTQSEAKIHPWVLKQTMRELPRWTSPGLATCIERLAWADEQCKSNGGDPVYALERCIELIGQHGRER